MKFKKLNTRCFNDKQITINHYTPSSNARSIVENGFKGSGPFKNNLSVYLDDDDHLKKDQYDIKKLKGQEFYKRITNGGQRFVNGYNKVSDSANQNGLTGKERDEFFDQNLPKDWREKNAFLNDPNNKYLITYGNADSTVLPRNNDENRMNFNGSYNDWDSKVKLNNLYTPIRMVANLKNKGGNSMEYESDNDVRVRLPNLIQGDLGESAVLNPQNISKDNIKIQIPYGAVTQANSQEYLDNLQGIDRSKFDPNDTYTRRIYNLYAKKNGLKQIADPRASYWSRFKTNMSNLFKKK